MLTFDGHRRPGSGFRGSRFWSAKNSSDYRSSAGSQQAIALQAAERSYYDLALGWGYPEIRAKRLAAVVMVALQRAIEDQTRNV